MAGNLITDSINGDNIAGGFLGTGQTWQDVTSSRAMAVEYTNDTGKPIMISIEVLRPTVSTTGCDCVVDGVSVPVCYNTNSDGSNRAIGQIIIANGKTYKMLNSAESATLNRWYELR
jgi:hypothetical protein